MTPNLHSNLYSNLHSNLYHYLRSSRTILGPLRWNQACEFFLLHPISHPIATSNRRSTTPFLNRRTVRAVKNFNRLVICFYNLLESFNPNYISNSSVELSVPLNYCIQQPDQLGGFGSFLLSTFHFYPLSPRSLNSFDS